MPMPSSGTYEYSVDALVRAQTNFRDTDLDGGSAAGTLTIYDSGDVQLVQFDLDDPSGSVAAGTGQLTLSVPTATVNADATGTAAYAELADSDGNVGLSIECAQGTTAASGYCVLNTLSITSGLPVTHVSTTIG